MGKPSRKRTRLPGQKRQAKPPSVTGYYWRKEGAGWDLRKAVYVTGNNGEKKRKQPYVAHLSGEAFGELKRRHTVIAQPDGIIREVIFPQVKESWRVKKAGNSRYRFSMRGVRVSASGRIYQSDGLL